MQQISKRLTSFVWYTGTLDLKTSFAWKARIKSLRRINPAGAGYVSFDPTRPANSLTEVNYGDVLTLDALGIVASDQNTFFNVDNGNIPVPRQPGDTMVFIAPAGDPITIDYAPLRLGSKAILGMPFGGDSEMTFSVNGGDYLHSFDASLLIADLPVSTFGVDGPGYTIAPRLATTNPTQQSTEYRVTLDY